MFNILRTKKATKLITMFVAKKKKKKKKLSSFIAQGLANYENCKAVTLL